MKKSSGGTQPIVRRSRVGASKEDAVKKCFDEAQFKNMRLS